nr:DUF1073 domain-containing protein [Borreliella bavariensis]
MVSYRFNGAGYILVKPKGEDEDLSKKINRNYLQVLNI